jgi:chaperone required for assembly of F1-ATPase
MKRFWNTAAPERHDSGLGGSFGVRLDGRPVRLPGGTPLRVPTAILAAAIAEEWQRAGGQRGGEMSWNDVPLTRLAGTAQERIEPDRGAVADALAVYAETDLLCYRVEHPVTLAQRQERAWQPWLDWTAERYGARLVPTFGVVHRSQDPAALSALRRALGEQSALALAALGVAIPALGSLVLGLALAEGALDAGMAHALAMVDETFQAEQWGEDAEAAQRRVEIGKDIAMAGRLLRLARGLPDE